MSWRRSNSSPSSEAPPRTLARIGGALYLIIIVGGIFGEAFIRNRVTVPGDAAAAAANLRSLELLWRFGVASQPAPFFAPFNLRNEAEQVEPADESPVVASIYGRMYEAVGPEWHQKQRKGGTIHRGNAKH